MDHIPELSPPEAAPGSVHTHGRRSFGEGALCFVLYGRGPISGAAAPRTTAAGGLPGRSPAPHATADPPAPRSTIRVPSRRRLPGSLRLLRSQQRIQTIIG